MIGEAICETSCLKGAFSKGARDEREQWMRVEDVASTANTPPAVPTAAAVPTSLGTAFFSNAAAAAASAAVAAASAALRRRFPVTLLLLLLLPLPLLLLPSLP